MKHKLLLFSIFFFFSLCTSAQIQNQAGTLFLKNDQKLTGKITAYFEDDSKVHFEDNTGNKQTFDPEEVREFHLFNGKRYASKTLKSNKSEKSLILQVILQANDKISLFKREASKTEFYVEKDNELHLLENNRIIREENGKSYKSFDHQYIRVLTVLMNDRFDLTQKLNKIKLEESDLSNILTEYADGTVSYYLISHRKGPREPYWSAYTQYSNHGSFLATETTAPSYGFQVGFQYHISKDRRSSLKVSLERSVYNFQNETVSSLSISTRYQYEIIKKEKYNIYLGLHLLDVGHFKVDRPERERDSSNFGPAFRFSPSIGFEYRPTKKFTLFAELNHLLQTRNYPQNNSFGLKYSFLK